ncbi:MAG: hypothetical protein M3Q97_06100 [Bacteroidota bacterium]|nr:hypothetical protein [Bacteroidota bacterium]
MAEEITPAAEPAFITFYSALAEEIVRERVYKHEFGQTYGRGEEALPEAADKLYEFLKKEKLNTEDKKEEFYRHAMEVLFPPLNIREMLTLKERKVLFNLIMRKYATDKKTEFGIISRSMLVYADTQTNFHGVSRVDAREIIAESLGQTGISGKPVRRGESITPEEERFIERQLDIFDMREPRTIRAYLNETSNWYIVPEIIVFSIITALTIIFYRDLEAFLVKRLPDNLNNYPYLFIGLFISLVLLLLFSAIMRFTKRKHIKLRFAKSTRNLLDSHHVTRSEFELALSRLVPGLTAKHSGELADIVFRQQF